MPKNKEPYIAFEEASHLISALYHAGKRNGHYFPVQEVVKAAEQGWAIPKNTAFGEQLELDGLSKQFGWKYRIVQEKPKGELLPLWNLLLGTWYYQDPYLHLNRVVDETSSPSREVTQYEPNHDHTKKPLYLLGGKTEENAAELLKILTGLLMQDIRAIPLLLESDGGQSPFRFFWAVTMTHPIVTALQVADGAWWRPIEYGETGIFLQWPYSLRVPVSCLDMFNWGDGIQFVLISQSEPHLLLLRQAKNQPSLSELIDVADLEVDQHLSLRKQSISKASDLTLKVRMRLVDDNPQHAVSKRINNLGSEIEAKTKVLQYIRQRTGEFTDLEQPGEPILLYYDWGDGIPRELRRLLLEWADQAESLRSLYYQKIEGDAFPEDVLPNRDGKKPTIHILTTAKALGKQGLGHMGMILGEYPPNDGETLTLLPKWAQFDLRLFVPHKENLILYPELYPSQVAADKLEKALLSGKPGATRHEWIVLLKQRKNRDKNDGLHALQLKISDFESLLNAYEWDCSLDFSTDLVAAAKSMSGAASAGILGIAQGEVMNHVDTYMRSLEQESQEMIKRKIETLEQSMAERQARFSMLNSNMAELQSLHNDIAIMVDQINNLKSGFLADVRSLSRQTGSINNMLKTIHRLEERLKEQSIQRIKISQMLRRFKKRKP